MFVLSGLDPHTETLTFQGYSTNILSNQRIKLAGAGLSHTIDAETDKHLMYIINLSFLQEFNMILDITSGLSFVSSVAASFIISGKKSR